MHSQLRYADKFGGSRGADCTNVHLARLIAGVLMAGLDVDDKSLARGGAGVLGYELSPARAYCSGTSKRISRIRPVARTVSSRRRIAARQRSSSMVTSLSWRSAIVGFCHFLMSGVSLRKAVVNCACGAKSIWRNLLSSP